MDERTHRNDIIVDRKPIRDIRIRVAADGSVRITAPHEVDISQVIRDHARWIEKKRSSYRDMIRGHEGMEHLFLFDGSYYRLTPGDTCDFDSILGEMQYSSPKELKRAVRRWLTSDLYERLERNAGEMGVSYHRVTIRQQASRWGSCSGKGNLNFNLRMMALPSSLREYIVIHELAHRIEPNHSPLFWELVERFSPEYKIKKEDLKRFWAIIQRNEVWRVLTDA
jgi:predicted metal-dependent hydrolase